MQEGMFVYIKGPKGLFFIKTRPNARSEATRHVGLGYDPRKILGLKGRVFWMLNYKKNRPFQASKNLSSFIQAYMSRRFAPRIRPGLYKDKALQALNTVIFHFNYLSCLILLILLFFFLYLYVFVSPCLCVEFAFKPVA